MYARAYYIMTHCLCQPLSFLMKLSCLYLFSNVAGKPFSAFGYPQSTEFNDICIVILGLVTGLQSGSNDTTTLIYFYESKNVDPDVSRIYGPKRQWQDPCSSMSVLFTLQQLCDCFIEQAICNLLCWLACFPQDLPRKYVS